MSHIDIVKLLGEKQFKLGNYHFVSQDPTALPVEYRTDTGRLFLPVFLNVWRAIEKVTGHRWKNTSYIRDSPSHKRGQAFDLAPDFSPVAASHYAVTKNSDPVLYKRTKLIRQLQTLTTVKFVPLSGMKLGIFIEPDHLHIQVLSGERDPSTSIPDSLPTHIVKWKVAKPVYPDTYERMNLPMLQ